MSALIWVIAALVLVGAEALNGELVLLMLAGGALGAAGTEFVLSPPLWIDGVVFAVVSILLLATVRPVARRHLRKGPAVLMNTSALEGKPATVTAEVTESAGQVEIAGDVWTARALNAGDIYPTGAHVMVMKITGATALVWKE